MIIHHQTKLKTGISTQMIGDDDDDDDGGGGGGGDGDDDAEHDDEDHGVGLSGVGRGAV